MSRLFFDHRWCAPHGIGRFATEVRKRLNGFTDLPGNGSPTDPIDPLRLGRRLQSGRADGFFSPGFNVPWPTSCPVVVTIHDLIHVHFRQKRSPLKRAYYQFLQRPTVQRSPLILTVSQYSRRQISKWYDVPESRVVCVGNGVSEDFTVDGPAISSDPPYFLYVGNTKPHKNVGALLRAFARLAKTDDVRCKLVVRPTAGLNEHLDSLNLSEKVDILSDLDDPTLAKYYRGARALVLPSYYEGFGLPLVEAMACGCPVIAADRTSIPEVVGGAGILFDPDDHDALHTAMSRILHDDTTCDEMIPEGLIRAQDFRWDEVADRIRAALSGVFSMT